MRLMGLTAIYQAPRTSAPHPAHRVYPYLLHGNGHRPAQPGLVCRHHLHPRPARLPLPVAIMDLGNPPCARLAAVEHHGRRVLRRGIERGAVQIRQTGGLQYRSGPSQFTSFDFTGVLKAAEITISMDGRGRCMDNIFIERLWRSLKYEAVYLPRTHRRLQGRTGHRRVDRLLQSCFTTPIYLCSLK